MQANKIAPIVAALLFLGSSLAVTASQDTVSTVPLPTFRQTLLGDLAERVAPGLRSELPNLEPLLPARGAADVNGALDVVDLVHGAYADAATAREALAATAGLAGLPLQSAAAPAPASATAEILAMYSLLGEAYTLADVADLEARVASLTPEQQTGLATLVAAANQALVLQQQGGSAYGAADGMLEAAEAAKGLLAPQASVSGCATWEDPQQLIWLGSPCNDNVSAQPARVLSYDPGGNDLYRHNAGGAGGVPTLGQGLVVLGFEIDHEVGEFLDGFRAERLIPIAPFNATWQNRLINGAPGNVANGTLYAVDFVPVFVGGVHPIVEFHPELLRTSVPVAFHIDEAGDDRYESNGLYVQGSAVNRALGVLLDRNGADTYVCNRLCQGYSSQGLGLLIDERGNDAFRANSNAQGSGDGGLLFEMSGNDNYTATASNAQGSTGSAALPREVPTLLLDRSGADRYTAGGPNVQGAGAMLVDQAGDDVYTQSGHPQGGAQGVGVTASLGLLLDQSGNDRYSADNEAQGVGISAPGILADLSGDDSYVSGNLGQAVSRATGFAVLYDEQGSDTYSAKSGQAAARDASNAVLLDLDGDDSYTATGFAQGVSYDSPGGVVAMLMDAAGKDTYVAGSNSQGSGTSGSGVGFLADLKGKDSYTAGANSQGSGGANGGVGILLDGLQERTETDSATVTLQVNSEKPSEDHYLAGDFSQGSSGPAGGIGVLLDREHNGGKRNTFVAGAYSQGAATAHGVGLLANNVGKDDYTAGAFSQGASDAGVGVLVDQRGNDRYFATDAAAEATSHGYGASDFSSSPRVAVGLLVDDGGHDQHPAMGNNECQQKGDVGVAIDADGLAIPGGCEAVIVDGIEQFVNEAAGQISATVLDAISGILFPTSPPAPSPVLFYDGMENSTESASKWTVSNDSCIVGPDDPLSGWRIRNQGTDPQASPNAHSGSQYWYVGAIHGAGYSACMTSTLTTQSIVLPTISNTTPPSTLSYWYAGTSEAGWDFLTVKVVSGTTSTQVAQYSQDAVSNLDPSLLLPTYEEETFSLASFAGQTIQVVFTFTSDANLELGQGWNIDDVLVA
jgi:hypothetical protein